MQQLFSVKELSFICTPTPIFSSILILHQRSSHREQDHLARSMSVTSSGSVISFSITFVLWKISLEHCPSSSPPLAYFRIPASMFQMHFQKPGLANQLAHRAGYPLCADGAAGWFSSRWTSSTPMRPHFLGFGLKKGCVTSTGFKAHCHCFTTW